MASRKTGLLFFVAFLLLLQFASAQQLIIAYGDHNAKPYAFIENDKLTDGIIKKIGDVLGRELDLNVVYRNIPRSRTESALLSGMANVRMINNPLWMKKPDRFQWSIPLFKETDVFIISKGNLFSISGYDDLKGKHVGTILGYSYSKGLMDAFEKGTVIREDSGSLDKNFKRLELGHIDCLIDSDILINYYLKSQHVQDKFEIPKFIASTQNIQAMFSPHLPVSIDQINAVFKHMLDSGKMARILDSYK